MSKKLFVLAKTPLGDMIVGLAFGKLSKILPVKKIKETNKAIAFWHPKPFWEKHILIVPKKAIKNLSSIHQEDYPFLDGVFYLAKELVSDFEWDRSEYSILVNGGNRQEVNQLHFHLYNGKQLKENE